MENPPSHLETVVEFWEDVIEDMEATAAEYREDEWDVLELHPGDVTPLGPDGPRASWGLDVLVPDDEFAELERIVVEESGAFDTCEVFRATGGGLVFAVVAMLDEQRRDAVVFPVYYHPGDAEEMLAAAREAGTMRTHLRTLAAEPVVTLEQADPSLFDPE
jgi:hypothetical protein